MPIVAESTGTLTPNAFDPSEEATWTFSVDMPPSSVFVKVFLGWFGQFAYYTDNILASLAILEVRQRLPDNSDQTLTLPALNSLNPEPRLAFYDPTMTHFTVGIKTKGCSASLLWTMEFWE